MALKGRFSRGTPLQLALERGTQPGAKLGDELEQLNDYSIKSRSDAEAVCRVLALRLCDDSGLGGHSSLHALIGLFQEVEGRDCPAFDAMLELGIPLLVDIVEAGCEDESYVDPDDVLFALKILVIYGTSEGTDAVIRAATRPFQGHPESERLFLALSDPLPDDFLALSLLDCANAARGNGGVHHPFDSVAGKLKIERWLRNLDPDHLVWALSATAALPYLSEQDVDVLLELGANHVNAEVRLEAAYARARLGREAGFRDLARLCLDVHLSEKARSYLSALGCADDIPAAAVAPDFRAKAEFSQWLAHPNELGRPPDDLEIIDQRSLAWPPEFEPKALWLIAYRLGDKAGLKADEVGIGLVGSVTFCLAGHHMKERNPEDVYAIHCYWELVVKGLIAEGEVEGNSTEYDGMLRQVSLDGLVAVRIVRVVEFSPEVKYPQRLIGLARAARNGEEGWVVVDGPRSRWYAASEMPGDVSREKQVTMVHVGRTLLGFSGAQER
jgi:hypothetical protein